MALPSPKNKAVGRLSVAGTMHYPAYEISHQYLTPGRRLELVPDPDNIHDRHAVKVNLGPGTQIGWIPKSASPDVAALIRDDGEHYAKIASHDYHQNRPYDCRLVIEIFQGAPPAPLISEFDLVSGVEERRLLDLQVGDMLNLRTTEGRSSVTVTQSGRDLLWFRKALVPGQDWERPLQARVVRVHPLQLELVGPYPGAVRPAPAADRPSMPAATLGFAAVYETPTTPQPQKEITMTKFDAILSANQSAAQTGAIMEAGRIANNQVAKLAAKQLPMMVRGYADTAIGKVLIANLAAQGAKYFRPEDAKLAALTDAMMVQAFQALLQTVDIEGFVDELLESKDIKRAMSKLPGGDDADESPITRRTRTTK